MLIQLDIYMQKNEVLSYLAPHTKINLKLVIDLNVRAADIKCREKIGVNPCPGWCGSVD